MRIILHTVTDIIGAARAAAVAMESHKRTGSDLIAIRLGRTGAEYSVKFTPASIIVHPNGELRT